MTTAATGVQQAGTGGDLSRTYNPFVPPQRDVPFDVWERARREAPVFFSEVQRAWIVTRYADICAILADPQRFSSADTIRPSVPPPPEVQAALDQGHAYDEIRTIVNIDPPTHTRIRKFIAAALTPQRVAAMEPRIRAVVNDLIDSFAADGHADFVKQFAYPLPLIIVTDLQGIPAADKDRLKAWSDDKIALQAGGNMSLEEHVAHARGYVEFQRYLEGVIAERRARPGDDLISLLINLRLADERPLTTTEIVGQLLGLISAGHETTSGMLAHALVLLMRHRDQWEMLVQKPSLAAQAVEEALRSDAPVPGFYRTATQDVHVGGVDIPKGARLMLMYGSGNRDEAAFSDPARFDICRQAEAQHLAFGRGIHFCVGSSLARLEGRVALETLAIRLPGLRLDPEAHVEWRPNAAFRCPTGLPLIWTIG